MGKGEGFLELLKAGLGLRQLLAQLVETVAI
jgi:hypothetical protein